MKNVYPNLSKEMTAWGLELADIADIAGISQTEARRRMSGETDWRLHEAVRICRYLNYYDVNLLFVRFYTKPNKSQSQV